MVNLEGKLLNGTRISGRGDPRLMIPVAEKEISLVDVPQNTASCFWGFLSDKIPKIDDTST